MADFEASEEGPVVIPGKRVICLKPVGADITDTYITLLVAGGMLFHMPGLPNPSAMIPGLAGGSMSLAEGAEYMADESNDPPVLFIKVGDDLVALCRIESIDLEAQAATIMPDKAVEAFELLCQCEECKASRGE